MSLIGTAIGALVALVPAHRPEDDKVRKLALKVADLSERFAALTRTREQLVNHIELIERQLDAERALANHWRGEAQRLARENRETRDELERAWRRNAPQTQRQADLEQFYQQNALAQQSQAQQQYDQHALAAQQTQQTQLFGQQLINDRFCNCAPSRAQVWGAHGGLVQQLNNRGE